MTLPVKIVFSCLIVATIVAGIPNPSLGIKSKCDTSIDPDKDVLFMLYTRKNPTEYQLLNVNNITSLIKSHYDVKKPTKIYIHGWGDNHYGEGSVLMRNAIVDMDANAIIVDWYEKAKLLFPCPDESVSNVGEFVGKMINWLVMQGSNLDTFHVMGHSLGAHVMGHAGRVIDTGKIPYLTALDPAGTNWGANSPRVRIGDGHYLEVIHTNTALVGISEAIGDNDFYPNGGNYMPGCVIFDSVCYHLMAYRYMAYSLNNTLFVAQQCNDLNELVKGRCANISQLHMGGSSAKEARGVFYVQTGPKAPYYL